MDRCYSVVAYHGPERTRGKLDGAVGIVDHHLFAKGVDVLLGAAGDAEAIRIRGGCLLYTSRCV